MDIIHLITTNQLVLIITCGILGLIIGSFLNVVIYRLPIILKNEYETSCLEYFNKPPQNAQVFTLAFPHSHCPNCKKEISWWQNIPLLSFLILRGKCNNCNIKISWRYPLIELITFIATIWITMHFGMEPKTIPMLILTWALIAAIFIDLEHQLLPDQITQPLIWLGLLLNCNYVFTSPQSAIIGAISGYLFLWGITKSYKWIRKVDGMGHGDFKLFAAFGAWVGWQMLPQIILAASLVGAVVGILLVLTKRHQFNKPLPFGPYLAVTGWLACLGKLSFINLFSISLLR